MKTTSLLLTASLLLGLFISSGFIAHAQLPFKPLRDAPANVEEARELDSMFALARTATASVQPGASAGFQRRQVADELVSEVESFVTDHADSAWTPSVRLWLARNAQARSAYGAAMEHYGQAWSASKAMSNAVALRVTHEAGGALAKLLVLTGRLAEYDAVETEARRSHLGTPGGEWGWAREMRAWAKEHPVDAFKCGLYCLDQLGRLTQPGQFAPEDITEIPSSTNGFTAAELVQIAGRVNLRVYAALLSDPANVPVPSIVHLSSGHFVVVREKRGDFYDVYDTVAFGPRWLTAEEIAREASGCVIISEATPPAGVFQLARLGASEAAAFRGWCHGPLPYDHDDSPCVPDENGCQECAPGSNGPGNRGGSASSGPGSNGAGAGAGGGVDCAACFNVQGMPAFFISEPWLNLWIADTPLHYDSAYGPDVSLRLAYNFRHTASTVSLSQWQGARFGNYEGMVGAWACSWLSFAELDSSENSVDVMLPTGGWATFTFPSGSSVSAMSYKHNLTLEKTGSPGAVSSLTLRYPDGSQAVYNVRDTNAPGLVAYAGLYYVSSVTAFVPLASATGFQQRRFLPRWQTEFVGRRRIAGRSGHARFNCR